MISSSPHLIGNQEVLLSCCYAIYIYIYLTKAVTKQATIQCREQKLEENGGMEDWIRSLVHISVPLHSFGMNRNLGGGEMMGHKIRGSMTIFFKIPPKFYSQLISIRFKIQNRIK